MIDQAKYYIVEFLTDLVEFLSTETIMFFIGIFFLGFAFNFLRSLR